MKMTALEYAFKKHDIPLTPLIKNTMKRIKKMAKRRPTVKELFEVTNNNSRE